MKKIISFAAALMIVAGCGGNVFSEMRTQNTVYAVGTDSKDDLELPMIPIDDMSSSAYDSSCGSETDNSSFPPVDESSRAPEKDSGSEGDRSSKYEEGSSMAYDDSSRPADPEWSESEDEAKARALDYKFDTVMVFKDGTEKKLDIDYEVKTEKNSVRSYKTCYSASMSREEAEKLFADMGKTYNDVDRVEYRITVSDGKDTDHSDDCKAAYRLEGAAHAVDNTTPYPVMIIDDVIQQVNSTVAYADPWEYGEKMAEDYNKLMFVLEINYSGAKVYKPTEAHKKAMMVEYAPKIALKLKDGTEIMTDLVPEKTMGYHENYIYSVKADMKDITKYITDAGRKVEEFDRAVGYIDSSYPAGQGIKDDCVISGFDCLFDMNIETLPQYSQVNHLWTLSRMTNEEVPAKFDALRILCETGMNGHTCVNAGEGFGSNNFEMKPSHIKSLTFVFDIDMRDAEMSGYSDVKIVKGDVTGDGKLNVADIVRTAAYVKGLKPLTDEMRAAADVNGDNAINVKDVVKIAAAVKGIKPL